MKTLFLLFSLLLLVTCFPVKAQSKGRENAVSFAVNVPTGNFSTTHFIGIAADYSPARHRFGLLKLKRFALTWAGGAAYYFGKKYLLSIIRIITAVTFLFTYMAEYFINLQRRQILFYTRAPEQGSIMAIGDSPSEVNWK